METRTPLVLNVWSGAATVLVVAALVSVASVLTGPYTSGDSKLLYSLGATLLAGSTFFAALALLERGRMIPGLAALFAAPPGWLFLVYAIWYEATSSSSADGEFWTGIVVLAAALIAAASHLLAETATGRAIAIGASGFALVAAVVSLDAAWRDEQFWRVGTWITSLWIVAAALVFLVAAVERARRRPDVALLAGGVLLIAAAAGIVSLVSGEFAPQGYSIFFTLVAAVLTTATLTGGVVALERGARVLGWIAVGVSPLAFAMLADGIWRESDDRFRFVATGIVLALALFVALAARLFATTDPLVRLADAAGALGALAALIAIDGIWRDDRYIPVARTSTALWVLATLCCLLVPVLERYRAATPEPTAPEALA